MNESTPKPVPNYRRLAELGEGGQNLLAILLIVAFSAYLTMSLHEPLLYWHLSLGDWILATRRLPTRNYFTVVGESLPFFSSSWLFDITIAWLFAQFGFLGLICFKLFLVILFIAVLAASYSRQSGSRFFAGLFVAMVGAGVLVRPQLTPELLGFSFFALVFEAVVRVRSGRGTPAALFSLFFVALVAANMVFPVVLCSAIFVGMSTFFEIRNEGLRTIQAQRTVCLFLAVALPTIITPYRGANIPFVADALWGTFFTKILRGEDLGFVTDYRIGILVLLLAASSVSQFGLQVRRLSIESRLLLLATMLAIVSRTLAPYALIAGGSLCAFSVRKGVGGLGNIGMGLDILFRKMVRLPVVGSIFLISCILYVSVERLIEHPKSDLLLPANELTALLESYRSWELIPLYHPSELGGYVLHRLGPLYQKAAFADALGFAYPHLAALERAVLGTEQGWERYFSTMLAPQTAIVPNSTSLAEYLASRPEEWSECSRISRDWRVFRKGRSCAIELPTVP